ncbi:hypothetical protein WICPIJ_009543, partial [Wickerhamomyces pijperi]
AYSMKKILKVEELLPSSFAKAEAEDDLESDLLEGLEE